MRLIAVDIRQAIVALLVAKEIDVPGRWLDVYATRAGDIDVVYAVIPVPELRAIISEILAALIERELDDQVPAWPLSSADVKKLLGRNDPKLRAA